MSREPSVTFQPIAGLLGWVLPGLGHCFLGQVHRGLLVLAGVMGLFLGGIFIGGIDVIDQREDKWWFVLQAGVGPVALATNWVHQRQFKVPDGRGQQPRSGYPDPSRNPGGKPAANTKSLGRVNEVGSLWAAMGGMLNAIAVIDALWYARGPRRRNGGAA